MHSISEAATWLGVTPKALRHWDSLGLLVPARRGTYRVYSDADLRRGAAIVLYQSAGMPLSDIASLLDAPSDNALRDALRRHRRELARRARELKRQVDAVDQLLKETTMDNLSIYFGDHMPAYQDEAEQRWGGTPQWAESQARLKRKGAADFERMKEEQDVFAADLAAAREAGVEPRSDAARDLVRRHRASISEWYEATAARQLILARMYDADERFHAAYRGEQDYLLRLVEAQAAAEGVDVDNPEWD
ncbi:MerR family transcriptional regulator [Corynebacterium lipophiloflavum]|uniref:TipAS antibiotic-recognition domain protein n=1 Tax=Corynebacterium lipophiloflavum (strain ATCC 700352 / DSM 44291 / CCUG 37336 / JCM 10383 / DMMZ 1944) TaxID=525263 RepID=C0XP95_CORLD|nr:TipAS antibiotic-recognition domain-containing protein [Corynebacterium lipophiloflavum]EEI17926.1 TipAS antibiotic-recognition domain protein [Corynebacterium lipophiloflavum DSM 44291]